MGGLGFTWTAQCSTFLIVLITILTKKTYQIQKTRTLEGPGKPYTLDPISPVKIVSMFFSLISIKPQPKP